MLASSGGEMPRSEPRPDGFTRGAAFAGGPKRLSLPNVQLVDRAIIGRSVHRSVFSCFFFFLEKISAVRRFRNPDISGMARRDSARPCSMLETHTHHPHIYDLAGGFRFVCVRHLMLGVVISMVCVNQYYRIKVLLSPFELFRKARTFFGKFTIFIKNVQNFRILRGHSFREKCDLL